MDIGNSVADILFFGENDKNNTLQCQGKICRLKQVMMPYNESII